MKIESYIRIGFHHEVYGEGLLQVTHSSSVLRPAPSYNITSRTVPIILLFHSFRSTFTFFSFPFLSSLFLPPDTLPIFIPIHYASRDVQSSNTTLRFFVRYRLNCVSNSSLRLEVLPCWKHHIRPTNIVVILSLHSCPLISIDSSRCFS
jgi:hypothetical protein